MNSKIQALLEFWGFMVKALIMHGICLRGLLKIHLNLRRLVIFPDIYSLILVHSMLDLLMPLFGVACVILLSIKLICILIMHAMLNLTLHHSGALLMLF